MKHSLIGYFASYEFVRPFRFYVAQEGKHAQ